MIQKTTTVVFVLCMGLCFASCDIFKQMESGEACEQIAETLFEVIEECVEDEGYQLDTTALNKNDYIEEACDQCDDDEVFVVDVDDCDDDAKKIDCDDILDLDSLRNYGLIVLRDSDNWEPSSCDDIPVDC